jgi:hypothetical protein
MSFIEADQPTQIDPATLRRHNLRLSRQADGSADALYHRDDVLLLPTEFLPRVGELDNLLADAGPGGRPELDAAASGAGGPGFTPRFTRVRLPEGNAAETLRKLQQHMEVRQPGAEQGDLAAAVARISLEHVALPHIPVFGEPGSKGHGYPGRTPVAVLPPPRRRRTLAELRCGRRPVVALLDTGVVLPHGWFPPIDPNPDGDAFVIEPEDWTASPLSRVPEPKELPPPDLEPLPSHAGHGTFIAGLIRQLAPDARVLSMRVMHSDDGAVYQNLLLNALDYLCSRVESGDPDRFVDVVSLSLGYREGPDDRTYTDLLREVLRRLGSRGVHVAASAGNRGEDVKTYPAALAAETVLPPRRVHSVGALNPNGTRARYSNHGDWVTAWEVATGVVSSFPGFDGGKLREPGPQPRAANRAGTEGLDPDDFTGGYATWSGTSFAAAALAGRLAQALIPDPKRASAEDALLDVRPAAANERAEKAYATYQRKEEGV